MWDLPRPGLEPVSPALAGRFSTTAPPGKPVAGLFKEWVWAPTQLLTICRSCPIDTYRLPKKRYLPLKKKKKPPKQLIFIFTPQVLSFKKLFMIISISVELLVL